MDRKVLNKKGKRSTARNAERARASKEVKMGVCVTEETDEEELQQGGKTPAQVGIALCSAKRRIRPRREEPRGTYMQLYTRAIKAKNDEKLRTLHLLGMRLRKDEDEYHSFTKEGRQRAVTAKFKGMISDTDQEDGNWGFTLFQARKVYDITYQLCPNQ